MKYLREFPFERLPSDVVALIISMANLAKSMRLVSKKYLRLVSERDLLCNHWITVTFKNKEEILNWIARCKRENLVPHVTRLSVLHQEIINDLEGVKMKGLDLSAIPCLTESQEDAIYSMITLEELWIHESHMNDKILKLEELRKLFVTPRKGCSLVMDLSFLKDLKLSHFGFVPNRMALHDPPLNGLSRQYVDLKGRNIQYVDRDEYGRVTESNEEKQELMEKRRNLWSFLTSMTQLTSLKMGGEDTDFVFLRNSRRLRKLHLQRANFQNFQAIASHSIVEMVIENEGHAKKH
eukprot:TRINITY_DN6463_c0_g1_i1.p1 TRINITY_DN6463_c0_g1~~TRINITY_DN6463_c0_g1_i1.p1  ORF type:complete len:334 (-),score=61.46 TRINITY_DN6463_c0_g1_i1:680-1561(-)